MLNKNSVVYKKAIDAIERFSMFEKSKSVLVALSGGKDSVCLLTILSALREKYSLSLYACHINHRIRTDEETQADFELCKSVCQFLNVELFYRETDIPALSGGISIEECARNKRYELLNLTASENNIGLIATAHSSTDSAETVIFNLLRGSALDGLCGIAPVRDNIIRPLIFCREEEILSFCGENSIPCSTDSTNSDSSYTRNFIRNKVSPLLRNINPVFEDSISTMSLSLRTDREYFSAILPPFTNDTEYLSCQMPSILSRMLKGEFSKYSGKSLSCGLLSEMTRMIYYPGSGRKSLSLPGRIVFSVERNRVYFEKNSNRIDICHKNLAEGENLLENGDLLYISTEKENDKISCLKNIYNLFICKAMKKEDVVGRMFVRLRMEGERYVCGKMTRSVKKLLQATKLPLNVRNNLPFICDEKGLIWAPFLPVRDSAIPDKDGEKFYFYYFYGKL